MSKSTQHSAPIQRRLRLVETTPTNPLIPERLTWWDEGEECAEDDEAYEARLEGFYAALELVVGTPGIDVVQLHGEVQALLRWKAERELEELAAWVSAERAARETTDDAPVPRLRVMSRETDRP